MKFALIALLGAASARHHHHHSLVQLQDPAASRAAWSSTRDASRAAVAEQERFMAEHNAMVAKNFADDTAATDTLQRHVETGYIRTMTGHPPSFVQLEDSPLGNSNETFVAGKVAAAKVVSTQEGFEAAKTADVAARNTANTNGTDDLKHHVTLERDNQIQGEFRHNVYPMRNEWVGRPAPAF